MQVLFLMIQNVAKNPVNQYHLTKEAEAECLPLSEKTETAP